MTAVGRAAPVLLAGPLRWREARPIAEGSVLELSASVRERIVTARTPVEAVVAGDGRLPCKHRSRRALRHGCRWTVLLYNTLRFAERSLGLDRDDDTRAVVG